MIDATRPTGPRTRRHTIMPRSLAPHRPSASVLCEPQVGDELLIDGEIWRITQRCGNSIYAGPVDINGLVPYDRAADELAWALEYARQRPS